MGSYPSPSRTPSPKADPTEGAKPASFAAPQPGPGSGAPSHIGAPTCRFLALGMQCAEAQGCSSELAAAFPQGILARRECERTIHKVCVSGARLCEARRDSLWRGSNWDFEGVGHRETGSGDGAQRR